MQVINFFYRFELLPRCVLTYSVGNTGCDSCRFVASDPLCTQLIAPSPSPSTPPSQLMSSKTSFCSQSSTACLTQISKGCDHIWLNIQANLPWGEFRELGKGDAVCNKSCLIRDCWQPHIISNFDFQYAPLSFSIFPTGPMPLSYMLFGESQ